MQYPPETSCPSLFPLQPRTTSIVESQMSEHHETRMNSELIDRLNRKTATIGIVGLGYVGLPLMLRYCEVGYKVVGFDIDQIKVDSLQAGKSFIEHISSERIRTALDRGFQPTTDFSRAAKID